MNTENEFDALARQKLEGRSIPFDENHWVEMQAVLNAQKKRKKRFGFWLGGGAALLLLIGGAWYLNGTYKTYDGPRNEVTELINKNATNAKIEPANTTVDGENNGNSRTEGNNRIRSENVGSVDSTSGSATITNIELNDRHEAATFKELNAPTLKSERRTGLKARTDRKGGSLESKPNSTTIARTTNDPAIEEANGQVRPDPTLATLEEPTLETANDPVVNSSTNAADERVRSDAETDHTGTAADVPRAGNTIPSDPQILNAGSAVGEKTGTNLKEPNIIDEKGLRANTENGASPAFADSTQAGKTELQVDSPAVEQAANDTSAKTPEPTVQLITPASPWEISVLGGVMRTNTRYTGANSDTWNSGVQQQWSMNAGMEVMHMGRNFGLGTGLHYGTYSERINANAVDNTTFNVINFWYLVPVDTTILVITGTTTVDTVEYLTGISIDTTINVITRGSDSTAVNEHVRDAREIVNKVSYLEIPLLLDGHLVQGRWSLGLRGGPTIGLLTGRRGSLPNDTGNGYTDFTDQAFREVVFGWTARAYVRYRFNAAWSIGIEPTMRGQFNNTLGNGDLMRRSTAYGVLLSLSYRLR